MKPYSSQEGLWRRTSSEIKREKKMEFEENIRRQITRKKKVNPNSSQEKLRRRASLEITRKKNMKPNSSQEKLRRRASSYIRRKKKMNLNLCITNSIF